MKKGCQGSSIILTNVISFFTTDWTGYPEVDLCNTHGISQQSQTNTTLHFHNIDCVFYDPEGSLVHIPQGLLIFSGKGVG